MGSYCMDVRQHFAIKAAPKIIAWNNMIETPAPWCWTLGMERERERKRERERDTEREREKEDKCTALHYFFCGRKWFVKRPSERRNVRKVMQRHRQSSWRRGVSGGLIGYMPIQPIHILYRANHQYCNHGCAESCEFNAFESFRICMIPHVYFTCWLPRKFCNRSSCHELKALAKTNACTFVPGQHRFKLCVVLLSSADWR